MSKYSISEENYKKLINRMANVASVCLVAGVAIGILIGVNL